MKKKLKKLEEEISWIGTLELGVVSPVEVKRCFRIIKEILEDLDIK